MSTLNPTKFRITHEGKTITVTVRTEEGGDGVGMVYWARFARMGEHRVSTTFMLAHSRDARYAETHGSALYRAVCSEVRSRLSV